MDSEASNTDTFIHSGVISKITGDSVIVSLEQNIHCESCRAKASCGISESNTKDIEIQNPNESFNVNETVTVVLKKTLGLKAVFWAYVFPFILIPYYLTLYLLKNTLKSAFKISIIKT